MIAGLILFLVLPVLVGALLYVVRKWHTGVAVLAVGVTTALGIAILMLPLGETVELWGRQIVMGGTVSLLGRELILEETDRIAIGYLYLTSAGVFLLAWQTSRTRSSGSLLFPVGFGILSLLSGSLLIRPLVYGALLVEIAIVASVFALQAEGRSPSRGALQYVSFALLALPGLLVIHWLMDRYALTPDNTTLRDAAVIMVSLSFALLMGSVPFHMWVPSLVEDSDLLASAFVLTVNHGAVWFLLLAFLEAYPELSAHARFGPLTSTAGLLMAGVGGVLGAAQRRPGRVMGYGALIDSGVALAAFGMVSEQGLALSLLCLLVRPFGLALMATGLTGLGVGHRHHLAFESFRGAVRRVPWSVVAFVVGGVSLAGLPVSAGFTGRWALYRALGPSSLGRALTMLGAGVGLMIGVWRGLASLLDDGEDPADEEDEDAPTEGPEGWLRASVVVLAVAACVVVGLAPQLLAPTAARLASLYTFLAP